MTYPFPDDVRDPDRKGPNPFADSAEEVTAMDGQPADDTDSAFASGGSTEYRPIYQRTLTARPRMVVTLGAVGLALCVFGWQSLIGKTFFLVGLRYASLAFFIPAITLGSSDLRAMRSGSMNADELRLTQVGLWLGNAAAVLTIVMMVRGVVKYGWIISLFS